MTMINGAANFIRKSSQQVLISPSGLFKIFIFLITLFALFQIPVIEVSAQATTLVLSPATGPPPIFEGNIEGSGWCYPASSVTVSGPGVTGAGSISPAGALSGYFSVPGSAGERVNITVSASCRSGGSSASATFKFTGGATKTPVPPPVVNTPTPTITLTPTATASFTPTYTPTFTITATEDELPGQDSILPYSGANTISILGCDPKPDDVQLTFKRFLDSTPYGLQFIVQQIPVEVQPGSQTGLFVFEPPPAHPGDFFAIALRLNSPDCPESEESTIDFWTPGSSVKAVFPAVPESTLLGSSLGNFYPGETAVEITMAGVWSNNLKFTSTPKAHFQYFQWSPDLFNYQGGVLQASILPFPNDTDGDLLSPPGLVAEWDVTCGNCKFSVDLSSLAYDQQEVQQPQSGKPNFLQQIWQFFSQLFSQVFDWVNVEKPPLDPPEAPANLRVFPGEDSLVGLVSTGKFIPPLITTYYFRVVPLTNNTVAGPASSQVRIEFYGINEDFESFKQGFECQQNPNAAGCPTPVPPPLKPYQVEIVGYHGIIPPKNGHEGCYIVTKGTTVMFGPIQMTFKEGDTLCPPKPKEKSWYEAVIDFALDGLNWVSTAYSDLKNAVVSIVAKFVPDALCGKKCLGTLLDAGLMALGIPPSIPNFDQLMTEGLDYLAAQAAGQLGIPQEVYESIDPSLTGIAAQVALSAAEEAWKEEAEKQIKAGLKAGLEAAQYSLSESISWIPNGVPIKADPLGDYQPSTLLLKVTRNPKVPLEADACFGKSGSAGNLWVLSDVSVAADQANKFNAEISTKTKNQKMQAGFPYYLYDSMYVPLPNLALGESQVVPVVLKPSMYSYWGSPWTSLSDAQDAWYTWYWNGQFNLSVLNPCTLGDAIQGSPDQSFGQ